MPRRGSPENWNIARRIGLANRLEAAGALPDIAERWVAAWETEARARGLDARSPAFWDGAAAWIAEQRKEGKR
jgi:hypothetical protein